MQIFSLKEMPTGEAPEFIIAIAPGFSCVASGLFILPITNGDAEDGMYPLAPVYALCTDHPVISIGAVFPELAPITMYSAVGLNS